MLDYRDRIWQTFDIQPILSGLLDIGARYPVGNCEDTPPTVYAPIVVMDGPQVVDGDMHYGDDEPVEKLKYGILDPQVIQAIFEVESSGEPFNNSGLPVIRFEAHIFQDRLQDSAAFNQRFKVAEEKPWQYQQWMKCQTGDWSPIHTGDQRTEYRALQCAREINAETAYQSIGMGIGQTMGFHHARLGYPSAQAMYEDYSKSHTAQLLGAVNYILSDGDLVEAVKAKDFRTIARLYNGNAVDVYAPRLKHAYEKRVS
jgi:hypothetical protein